MSPDLALATLRTLPTDSVVLDPMAGSGTVLRHATSLGFRALGYDVDPLAVLMAQVWTRPVSDSKIVDAAADVLQGALSADPSEVRLSWIDDDAETQAFIEYWFGPQQRRELRCIVSAIMAIEARDGYSKAVCDVLRLAVSRVIITKESAASLARDTSHSRPHRVAISSTYSVFEGYAAAVESIRKRLKDTRPKQGARIRLGDARNLKLADNSVDAVITSPPYLNAIDYLRGHRLALVWLGHSISELRSIRASSIGAERGPDGNEKVLASMRNALGDLQLLKSRHRAMIDRYLIDLQKTVAEITRVLKPKGVATFVLGNSCLQGVFIRNADALATAAKHAGLVPSHRYDRDLPAASRYLPVSGNSLSKRMRTETILAFTVS